VLETLEGTGHVTAQKGDANARVDREATVVPGKHVGGGLDVEESVT
jgi:hypothetical protein